MRTLFSVLLPAALFLAVAPLLSAQGTRAIVPADWYPALSSSITTSLQNLRKAETQTEMNSLSRQVADMTDAQLYIAYVRLYEKLSAKERAKLLQEQTAWLKKRPKIAKAGVESEGGSLAPLEANNAELTYTEKRLQELRKRFKALGKKSGDDEG